MTPFSLILNLLTHYFHKILDPIGPKFVSRAEPGYRVFDEVLPRAHHHSQIHELLSYKIYIMMNVILCQFIAS